jgi:glycosyltransferase involved in cell wall biosynthesis
MNGDGPGGRPGVSVIVPCYNAGSLLADTLNSILASDLEPADLEVIAVNDGSTDGTRDVLRAFEPRVRVVDRARNGGTCRARNDGLAASRGRFIALCDHDDLWRADKLRRQLPLFERPGVGLVCSDAEGRRQGRVVVPSLAAQRPLYRGRVLERLLRQNFIVQSSAVVRREALAGVGGWDEEVFPGEDLDLWLRLAARWEVDYVPEVLVHYRLHEGSVSQDVDRMQQAKMRVIEAACRRHCTPWQRRRIVAYNLYRHGRYLFQLGRPGDGRERLLAALGSNPFDARAWLFLLFSFVRRPVLAAARRLGRTPGLQA